MTTKQQAEKEARKIFYKIERLVFDAVRTELKDELDAMIREYFAQNRQMDQQKPKQPRNENRTQTMAAKEVPFVEGDDDYATIRHIINDYIRHALEEQAPSIVAQTLAQALKTEAITTNRPS